MESNRTENGSRAEAHSFSGNMYALRTVQCQIRFSKKKIFLRFADPLETLCNFTCITEAKRKQDRSNSFCQECRWSARINWNASYWHMQWFILISWTKLQWSIESMNHWWWNCCIFLWIVVTWEWFNLFNFVSTIISMIHMILLLLSVTKLLTSDII